MTFVDLNKIVKKVTQDKKYRTRVRNKYTRPVYTEISSDTNSTSDS